MSSPVGRWCQACQRNPADLPGRYCVDCKDGWRRGVPAAGLCVECHVGEVAGGDILCWWCMQELVMSVSGEDEPPCND